MMTWLKRHIVFVLTVIAPTCIAILYYGFFASDVFISESRFLVRSPQHPMQGGFVGELLQGSGFTHSQDDTYSVHDYILSRDALRELEAKLGVRKAFTSKQVDPINRFAGLSWDDSFERFYLYYGKHVGVEYDTASSISTLTVRAFTAQDAERINDLLLP
jgi:capsular polysaccharide transport system permease protein